MTWIYFAYKESLFIELSDGIKHGKVMISPKELADNDVERMCLVLQEKFGNLADELRHLKEKERDGG
jgi:hypothetical protein